MWSTKYKSESEHYNTLNFLDIKVKRQKVLTLTTSTYHKKIFTGVYLNWKSFTSRKSKIYLIKCLLDRIWKICSIESENIIEMEQLRNNLLKNDYSQNIIQLEFDKFLKKKIINEQINERIESEKDIEITTKYL